jgi:hypothetical protein
MKPPFVRLPDPISEEEVKLTLTWSADEHTTRAISRQATLMGFESPTAYLTGTLAAVIAAHESDTFVDADGQVLKGIDLPDA